jgi:hypothetical protein
VYVAGVPQQLPHFPQRAAGDRGVEPGQFGRRGKQRPVGIQRRDVLVRFHRDIMPARSRPPLEDPCSVIAPGVGVPEADEVRAYLADGGAIAADHEPQFAGHPGWVKWR